MTNVDCPMKGCKNNVGGTCNAPAICLKWRFAADMGKGNIVCLECLQLDLMVDVE